MYAKHGSKMGMEEKMTEIQPVEDIARTAYTQYSLAVNLKHRGHYAEALEYFRKAERKYESLADQPEISAAERLDYLAMQKECLESMLADAFNFDIQLWANIMIKLQDVKEDIEEME